MELRVKPKHSYLKFLWNNRKNENLPGISDNSHSADSSLYRADKKTVSFVEIKVIVSPRRAYIINFILAPICLFLLVTTY